MILIVDFIGFMTSISNVKEYFKDGNVTKLINDLRLLNPLLVKYFKGFFILLRLLVNLYYVRVKLNSRFVGDDVEVFQKFLRDESACRHVVMIKFAKIKIFHGNIFLCYKKLSFLFG